MKEENQNRPEYLRATITQKLKEKELQRIEDKVRFTHTAEFIATDHINRRKDERFETNFNQTKQTGLYAVKKQQLAQKTELLKSKSNKTQTMLDGVPVGEIKTVTVKTANKSIR